MPFYICDSGLCFTYIFFRNTEVMLRRHQMAVCAATYRIRLLFTHKTDRSRAAPVSKLERHIWDIAFVPNFHAVSPIQLSPTGFFIPVIPTQTFPQSFTPDGIPHPVHTFHPESRPHFALKSWIPVYRWRKSRILKNLLGEPSCSARRGPKLVGARAATH